MSGQQLVLNSIPNDPSLSDLLNLLKKEIMLDLNCHHVGTIQSFDSGNQTVQATVNYTKTYFQLNAATGLYQAKQINYPVAVSCPLIMLGGGSANITFPITKGDECLLLFNDRDIDNWFSAGTTTQPVASSRLHSFSDCFALVGVKSTPNALTAYDSLRALITNGTVMIGINPQTNLVTIKNESAGSLGVMLETLAESVCIPGAPIAPTVATQVTELLE